MSSAAAGSKQHEGWLSIRNGANHLISSYRWAVMQGGAVYSWSERSAVQPGEGHLGKVVYVIASAHTYHERKAGILQMTDEKKQRKPWYRLRNIVLAMMMLFVGGIIYTWYWLATMEPTVSHDYEQDLIDLSVSVQFASDPASPDNAWPHLMSISEIVQKMSEVDDGNAESFIGELRRQHLDELLDRLKLDGAEEAYRTAIDELDRRGALELITQARECPIIVKQGYIDDGGQLIGAYIPEISNSWTVCPSSARRRGTRISGQ